LTTWPPAAPTRAAAASIASTLKYYCQRGTGTIGGFVVGYLWPVYVEEEDEEFDPETERKTMLLGGAAAWRRSSQKGKETAAVEDDPEAARKTQLTDEDTPTDDG